MSTRTAPAAAILIVTFPNGEVDERGYRTLQGARNWAVNARGYGCTTEVVTIDEWRARRAR